MAKKIGTKKVEMYGQVVKVNVYGPPEESDFKPSKRQIRMGSFNFVHPEHRSKNAIGRKGGRKGKINIGSGRPKKKPSKASGPSESSE